MTYGQWLAAGWTRVMELPASESPLLGNGEACGLLHGVMHITLHGEGTCTVEAGTPILQPLWASLCDTNYDDPLLNDGPGTTGVELRGCAVRAFDVYGSHTAPKFRVTVDGDPIAHPGRYFAVSPVFHVHFPEDSIYDPAYCDVCSGADTAKAAGAAWLMLLRPLAPGIHMIRVRATHPDPELVEFIRRDITIVVTPPRVLSDRVAAGRRRH